MSEENQTQEKPQEKATTPNDDGADTKEPSIVDRAYAAAERIEAAEKRIGERLKRMEELEARRILGGKSEGKKEEPKQEEDPREYADKALKGMLNK